MNVVTILDAYIAKFKKENNFNKISESSLFEIFVNSLIGKHYHYFNCLNDLDRFDLSNVGGDNDSGIDGLFIRVNDILVFSKSEIDSIVKTASSIKIEFIFIQSKNQTSIDTGELAKFCSGVKNFLSDKQRDEVNAKLQDWIEIKNYLFDPDIVVLFDSQPKVTCFYVYKGNNLNDMHVKSKIDEFKDDCQRSNFSKEIVFDIIDGDYLFNLAKDSRNNFEMSIPYKDSFELKDSENVESSCVILCSAKNLMLLLEDSEGGLRRELFNDNVRDYQGTTSINKDISITISDDPSKFCLLNNGITIVCKKAVSTNRKITITNPQIVNGCQTCTTLYNSCKEGADISKVDLIIKVIATGDLDVMNAIIKGTNRQNIVYDEAFEITKEFHKKFEEYIQSVQKDIPSNKKIYYERRNNQYLNMNDIDKHQVFNLTILTQSFVSTFLLEPHHGFEHLVYLLENFNARLYNENDFFEPYFVSALLFLKLDTFFRNNLDEFKYFIRYRFQIMSLFIHMISGRVPNLTNYKDVSSYCKKILDVLYDDGLFNKHARSTILKFDEIKTKWIDTKGIKFAYAIKDNVSFVNFMFQFINIPYDKFNNKSNPDSGLFRGVVNKVGRDRNGYYYCYIKSEPNDIFVHQEDSPRTIFSSLFGKEVLYRIVSCSLNGDRKGKIVNVLKKS